MKKSDIMVSVLCTAYNHEKYIVDTLESILNQKVNFKFELLIHDDASTDKTADIIKEYEQQYPNVIKPIYQKKNQYSQGCKIYPTFLFPKVCGKYIAFCEGDDYWIDAEKLQKQVEFMEEHEDYSLYIHNAVKLNNVTGERMLLNTFKKDGTYSQEEQLIAGLGSDFPAFASYLCRASDIQDIPDFFLEAPVGDYPYRQFLASVGKVYYSTEPMSVYRTALPHSYMSSTANDQKFYADYTLGMIDFFTKLDEYTKRKFSKIIQDKIESDYCGYCTVLDEETGIEQVKKKGYEIERVEEWYSILKREYIAKEILEVAEMSTHLFIYGTSRLASLCMDQLEYHNVSFEGYVVSDGRMKTDTLNGKNVYYLSEILRNFENPGFILGIQPVNAGEIINYLKSNGVRRFCVPYKVRKEE